MNNHPYNVLANRAAEYLRYSSDGQNEATISAQHRIVETYAEQEGYTIVKSYVDEAETATTSDNRDAFLQMLADAKKGYFDYIIVWQFSRFARNKEESVIYKAMLRKIGVRVISATEKTDDTPSGKLLEGMLEVLNQYFSDNLSVEVKKGKKENVLTGKHAGGALPYGIYKEEETTLFKIDEKQGAAVRMIFDLYLKGYGARRIAAQLQEKGYVPAKGDKWVSSTVRQILDNEAYIGIYNYTLNKGTKDEETYKLDNIYPPIIDGKTWALSRKLKLEKKPKRSTRNRLYLLTGKTICGCCNRNYVGHSGSQTRKGEKVKHYYYRCNGKKQTGKHEGRCTNKDVNAEKIEMWVLEKIAEHILSDKAIETILDSVNKKIKDKSKNSNTNIKKLEKEAKDLDDRIEHYLDLYDEKKISKARLTKRTENLEKVLATVRLELDQLKKLNSTDVDLGAVRAFLLKHRANMQDATDDTKKALIDAFVHRVIIGSDKVTLTLKVDEELDDTMEISDAVVDMSHSVVTIRHIYTTEIVASFDEATKKRYTPYDPDYEKYDAERREYRQARKAAKA